MVKGGGMGNIFSLGKLLADISEFWYLTLYSKSIVLFFFCCCLCSSNHGESSHSVDRSPLSSVQSVENCVCILRNLSYHVHKEIPGAERFQEPHQLRSAGPQKKKNEADCLGGIRTKGRRCTNDSKADIYLALLGFKLPKNPSVVYMMHGFYLYYPYFLKTTSNTAHLSLTGRYFFGLDFFC